MDSSFSRFEHDGLSLVLRVRAPREDQPHEAQPRPVLTGLFFDGDARVDGRALSRDEALFAPFTRELARYLRGEARGFGFAWAIEEGTPFQREVWRALTEIPYGATWSYAELARAIGRPRAVRAVGAANGKNPLSVVVPCHRVVGSDGSLTGYAGGVPVKARLLALEARGLRSELEAPRRESLGARSPTLA